MPSAELLSVDQVHHVPPIVVGSGIAGISTALSLPEAVLVTSGSLGQSGSTPLAQGGIAAATRADDTWELHADDTLAVAGELAVPDMVHTLTRHARDRVDWLVDLGAHFDITPQGGLALGREAGHHRRRVIHANGDATGAEVARALTHAVRQSDTITVIEHADVLDLATSAGRVVGVLARLADGSLSLLLAPAVVLATGGLGQLYARTTNPREVYGGGLAMAARAGAKLIDLEFVQFHPTALDTGSDPLPLLSEALRGEGAVLIDDAGERFMVDLHPEAELGPRDVVARAIFRKLESGPVYLDATGLDMDISRRFPTAYAHAQLLGLDPKRDPLPVTPAEHFHMGGVAVNAEGATTVPGLYAVGEVSSTGVHGANRLASNSLLEGLVFGATTAEAVTAHLQDAVPAGTVDVPETAAVFGEHPDSMESDLRQIMWQKVGLVRDGAELRYAIGRLRRMCTMAADTSPRMRDMVQVARLITEAALARRESRGAHYRSDWPETNHILAHRRAVIPTGTGARRITVAIEESSEPLLSA